MKKFKKIIVASLLCIATIFVGAFAACGNQFTPNSNYPGKDAIIDGDFAYIELTNNGIYTGTYEVKCSTMYGSRITGDIAIPSVYNGKDVKWLGHFESCYMSSVTIPDSIEIVTQAAFAYCYKLETVTMGKGIKGIPIEMFKYCQSLKNIGIPNTITTIGDGAFENCSSLEKIVLPESITKIGSRTFNGCIALKEINIPKNVTNIGNAAFRDCVNITIKYEGNSVEWDKLTSNCSFYLPSGATVTFAE